MAAFVEPDLDLSDSDQRAQYIELWLAHLKSEGFRIGEEAERDADGHVTLTGLAEMADVFAHNISIQLRDVIDLVGRDSEAGKVVSGLWHSLVSQSSAVHNIARHHARKEQV